MKVDPRAQIHMMSHLNSLAASKRGKKKAFNLDDATEGVEEQKEVTPPSNVAYTCNKLCTNPL